jgi:hypothetical protein
MLAAVLAALVLTSVAAAPACADDGRDAYRRDDRGHYDRRGGHDRRIVVVPVGHRVRTLPPRYTRIVVNRRPYYYYGGLFYQPYNRNYVVVGAPIGARVGWLPPGYVSFGLGGRSYSYFNATFYLWDPPRREYIVVEKPAGADEALAGASGREESGAELYVYPARGQSTDQAQRDRYECHLWAVDQTRFDPSMGDADAAQGGEYRRAITACLEGRGYTVR